MKSVLICSPQWANSIPERNCELDMCTIIDMNQACENKWLNVKGYYSQLTIGGE